MVKSLGVQDPLSPPFGVHQRMSVANRAAVVGFFWHKHAGFPQLGGALLDLCQPYTKMGGQGAGPALRAGPRLLGSSREGCNITEPWHSDEKAAFRHTNTDSEWQNAAFGLGGK